MPIVVRLHAATLSPPALARLTAAAAADELVLVGAHRVMRGCRVSELRTALAPRPIVVLLVDDHVPAAERALILELLNDGIIVVILTPLDPPPPALTSWLDDARPESTPTARRRARMAAAVR